jgi:hypothetical protein
LELGGEAWKTMVCELYAYGRKRGWPVTVSKGTEEREREYSAFVRFVKSLQDEFLEGVPAQYGQETTLAKEILIATPHPASGDHQTERRYKGLCCHCRSVR